MSWMFFDEGYFDQTMQNFDQWSKRPDAALWYGSSWAEGVRP